MVCFFHHVELATPALTEHVFGVPYELAQTPEYQEQFNNAANEVGRYMGVYGLASMAYALLLTFITRKISINRKYIHLSSLIIGGLGFISMFYISEPWMLNLSFAAVGIAWASILSMPYAMLSGAIDKNKMGIYMGLFNMFIVIPQIVAALGGINISYKFLFGDSTINTMLLAGTSLIWPDWPI